MAPAGVGAEEAAVADPDQASTAVWRAADSADGIPPAAAPDATDCREPLLESPFLVFGDHRSYALAPGGAFESDPAGWALRGAEVVPGNEPWYVRSPTDEASLRIPSGTTVTSAPMCVDLHYPTFRLFVRERLATPQSTLGVEVVYADAEGSPSQAVGKLAGAGGWEVTPDIAVLPELGGTEPGWRLVRFRFTARDGGYRIDDLYVDPRNRH